MYHRFDDGDISHLSVIILHYLSPLIDIDDISADLRSPTRRHAARQCRDIKPQYIATLYA